MANESAIELRIVTLVEKNRMNKLLFLLFLLCVLHGASLAFVEDSLTVPASHLSLGLTFSEIRNQPGVGLAITTPYFLNDKVALRFSGNLYFLFNIPLASASEQVLPYISPRFGAVYVAGTLAESMRLCLLGGVTYILPGTKISDDKGIGGYVGFGFEFFTGSLARSRISFLFESSIVVAPVIAEKLPGQPIYASGIDLSAGIRYYF